MAGRTVGLTLNIVTSDTAQRLAAVDLELAKIATSLKEAKRLGQTDVYANLKQQQTGLRGEAKELNKELTNQNKIFQAARFPADSVEGLRVKLGDLKTEYFRLSKAVRDSDVGLRLKGQIQAVTGEVSKAEQGIGVFTRNVGNYKGAILDAIGATGGFGSSLRSLAVGGGVAAAVGAGIGLAVDGAKQLFQLNKQIADLQADVQKTTQLTLDDARALTEQLKGLDTRTPIEGLLEIATVAGRLGVQGREGVFQFTKAVDTLAVALGDDLGGDVETVTDTVGKLSNTLFGATTDGTKLSQNLLFLGNALNVLSAEGAASAGTIADFAGRIGAIGIPLGVTQGEILGISTTLDELNVTAERGGSAVTRIFQALTQDTEKFASALDVTPDVLRAAGFEANSLAELVNTDLTGALRFASTRVLELSENNIDLSSKLKEVGLTGAGELEVFLKLGQANERLGQNINTATTALQNQNSLTAEAQVKNENLAGAYERLRNDIREAFVSSGVQDFFVLLIEGARESFQRLKDLAGIFSPLVNAFYELAKVLGLVDKEGKKTAEGQKALDLIWQASIFPLRILVLAVAKLVEGYTFLQRKGQDVLRFFGLLNDKQQQTAQGTTAIVDNLLSYTTTTQKAAVATNKSAAAITKQITTIDSLQERLKALREEQGKTEIGSTRFKALGVEIKAVEKQINNALGKASKEAENFARGSIGLLNERLGKLRQELEKAPNATIFNKVSNQIQDVERQLDLTEARFKRFRDAQTGVLNVVQTVTTLNVEDFTQGQDLTPVGGIGSALEDQRVKKETEVQKIIKDLRVETNDFLKDIDEKETERQKKEAEKRADQIQDIATKSADVVQSFIEGGIKSAEDFQKALLLIALEAIQKQFLIASFELLAREVGSKGFLGLVTAGILQGVLAGAFAALKSSIQGAATGGEVQTYSGETIGSSKRISGRGKDTVMIAAYPGEKILNIEQQKRAEMLFGSNVWGALGLPGFADGGTVLGATPQIINPNISLQRNISQNDSAIIKESLAEFKAIARDLKAAIGVLPDATGISVQQGVLQAGELSDRRKALRNDTQV